MDDTSIFRSHQQYPKFHTIEIYFILQIPSTHRISNTFNNNQDIYIYPTQPCRYNILKLIIYMIP